MARQRLQAAMLVTLAGLASGCGLSPDDVVGTYVQNSGTRRLYRADGVFDVPMAGQVQRTVRSASRYDIIYLEGMLVLGEAAPEEGCDLAAYLTGNEALIGALAQCDETLPDGRRIILQLYDGEATFSQELLQLAAIGAFIELRPDGTNIQGEFEQVVNLARIGD
jgi:hypothetical protein